MRALVRARTIRHAFAEVNSVACALSFQYINRPMPKQSTRRGRRSSSPEFPPPGQVSQKWLVGIMATELWRISTSEEKTEKMFTVGLHELATLGILKQERVFWDGPTPKGFSSRATTVVPLKRFSFEQLEDVLLDRFYKVHPDEDEVRTTVGRFFYNLRHLDLIRDDRVV